MLSETETINPAGKEVPKKCHSTSV